MAPSVSGSASAAAERTAAKLEAIRNKMPSSSKAVRVEAKYDVVLDYPNLELHSAAASGNVGLVHYALTHGQPVNSLLHGCLPLHAASSGGNVSVVRMLIERGADVNAPRLPRRYSETKKTSNMPAVGTAGSTPLHFAAANGHPAVVQLLLACGAISNKPDKNGMTPEDLAEMSGHAGVVHTIRVWRQMNNVQAQGPDTKDGREPTAGPSRRPRRASISSSQWTESDTGGESPAPLAPTPATSTRKLERAGSVVSLASEKGINRLRSSFDNVRNGVRLQPLKTPFSKQQQQQQQQQQPQQPQPPSTPQQQPPEPLTPHLLITGSTPPRTEPGSQGETLILGSPFYESLLSSEPDDMTQLLSPASASSDSLETIEQNGYPQRSSHRPSLPSINEKAGHQNNNILNAIAKSEHGSSSASIAEVPTTSPQITTPGSGGTSFFRGRSRNVDRRINKQAILGLFRRGASPHSRSPSPPRKTEPRRPIDVDEVDANVARLKRASMDPDLMRMALVAAELSEQLEANETTSAPVTRTRFFEDAQRNASTHSLSSAGPAPYERPWERRKNSGVISPSPLAREWSAVDDSSVPRVGIRRTRTEVHRVTPSGGYPRRMPSEPHMAAASIARRRSMVGSGYTSRVVSDPASRNSTPIDSPLPLPSDAEAADDEAEDVIERTMPSIQALAASRLDESPDDTAQEETTPDETEEEENDSNPSPGDVPSLTLDAADDSELTSSTELKELDNPSTSNLGTSGRFRGESIGSTTTESSRGLRTPPSSLGAPLGPGSIRHDLGEPEYSVTCPEKDKPRQTRSRGHSETSMASILASGFPPVPEHETADGDQHRSRPPMPVRRVSSHAEARDVMQQTERGVLEIAQMPMTKDSAQSLADQLAAYGDSHALAQEFARAEGLSSLSSSSERNSIASSDSAKRRPRPVSSASVNLHNGRMLGRSPPTVYSGSVPAIGKIYDLRDQAYRDRLQALTSSTPIYGMRSTVQRSRTVSGEHPSGHRSRASTSDTWLTAGPSHALSQRRLTEPSAPAGDRLGRLEGAGANPHISGPLPMVSDPLGIRPGNKNRPRSTVSARPYASHPSSLKGLAPLGARPNANTSGLGRSVSLHRPNDKVNSVRYQGLAQARNFAAATQPMFVPGHSRGVSDGVHGGYGRADGRGAGAGAGAGAANGYKPGHGHSQSHSHITTNLPSRAHSTSRSSEDFTEITREFTAVSAAVGAPDWRTYVPSEADKGSGSKWGQLKGAIGNLRR